MENQIYMSPIKTTFKCKLLKIIGKRKYQSEGEKCVLLHPVKKIKLGQAIQLQLKHSKYNLKILVEVNNF